MSDKKFNIFQVGGYWEAEEFHTRVIAELINPQSHFHDMGTIFLEKFLSMRQIGIDPLDEKLEEAEVKAEVPIDTARNPKRIDMVISTKNYYLPFEVKIKAPDQKAQLWDYYGFAKKQADDQKKEVPVIYYLTTDGHKPSAQSRKDLTDEQIRVMSFKEDILPWLNECIKEPGIPTDVLEIMKQLRDNIAGIHGRPGIEGFSRWTGEDVLDEIYRKLSQERKYDLAWTECTADYMTFTLNIMKFGTTSLEFALRVKKEPGNRDLVRLYLICGVTQGDEKPDYSDPGTYISKNRKEFEELLKATFKEGGRPLKLKTSSRVWNRLPEGDKGLNAEDCLLEIKKIFEELNQ